MLNKVVSVGVAVVAVLALALSIYNFVSKPKIAFVRSQDLVMKYEGTKEASGKFQQQKLAWQANVDTLASALERDMNRFNKDVLKMKEAEKRNTQNYLVTRQQQLSEYSNTVDEKAQEENDKMMQSILNQINTYVEEYGKTHAYDIILGTTMSGNVLYGEKGIDITDDILGGLNKNYKGKMEE
jgi:outer membrane protein